MFRACLTKNAFIRKSNASLMPFQSLSMTKTSPILNQWSVVVQQRNQIRTADFNTPRNQTRWFTTNNRPTDTNNNNNNNDNNSSSSDNSDTPKSDNINEPKPSTNHNNPPRHLTSSERWMERLTVAMRPLEAKIRASATFQDVSSLLDEMERRKYNYRRYVILGVAFFLWLFYDFITRFFSNRVADISKTYLENPQFKRDIEQFIRSPEIQASAKSLVTSVINDPEVQQRLQTLLSNTLSKTIADDKLREDARERLTAEMTKMLNDEMLQRSVSNASLNAIKMWFMFWRR